MLKTQTIPSQAHMPESDVQAHIEDTPLYWTWRNGQPQRRTWNELTATERDQQIEAQRRAEHCTLFQIYE